MNLNYSPDEQALRADMRDVIAQRGASLPSSAHKDARPFDRKLWAVILSRFPALWRGSDGYLGQTILASETGYGLAAIPWLGNALVLPALAQLGVRDPKFAAHLRDGKLKASVAWILEEDSARFLVRDSGSADGHVGPVVDGDIADLLLTVDMAGSIALFDLNEKGVGRRPLQGIDLVHGSAEIKFEDTPVLAEAVDRELAAAFLHRAAILTAFEQIGGADRCIEMAASYAKQRIAFGQPIGAFQAVKHRLATMLGEVELARSNAYFGACALDGSGENLLEAACLARVSASEAYNFAAQECVHLHGAYGTTWACEAHLHLRRARSLSVSLGSAGQWRDALFRSSATSPSGAVHGGF